MASDDIEKACNRWLNGFFSWEENISEAEVDCAREGFLAGANWARNTQGSNFVILQPAPAFWEAISRPHLCIGMKIEGDSIICLAGDIRRYRFYKRDFPANAVCSPDFSWPAITDHGQTLVFGDYQAAFEPDVGRLF